jgi:hypothetical protein
MESFKIFLRENIIMNFLVSMVGALLKESIIGITSVIKYNMKINK